MARGRPPARMVGSLCCGRRDVGLEDLGCSSNAARSVARCHRCAARDDARRRRTGDRRSQCEADHLGALNAQRAANGIPPVRYDARMSAGCAAHDRHVLRNGLSVIGEHHETPGRPGYTLAGDHAARTSVLGDDVGPTVSRSQVSVGAFGDPWNFAAFHLFQLVNPALAVSGANERTGRLRDGHGSGSNA